MVLLSPPRKSVSGLDLSSLTLQKSHYSGVWSLAVTSHPLEKQSEYIDTCAICSPKDCIHFSVHKIIFTSIQLTRKMGFPGGLDSKESTCNAEDLGSIPGLGDPLENGMATHSSILTWRIPWTEEPGIYSS